MTLPPAILPLHVLLAEDNTVNQEVIGQLLRNLDVTVQIASDGAAACSEIRQDPDAFDLVFMDCDMPVLDGFAATQRIRAEGIDAGRLPILALTAGVMPGDRDRCLEAGMNGYLAKPISGPELVKAIIRQIAPGGTAGPPAGEESSPDSDDPRAAPREPPDEGANEGPLDPATLARLRALPGRNGRSFLSDMTERFLATAETQAEQMQAAAAQGDAVTLRRTAHSLKSSSASMGATALSRHCREIETVAGDSGLQAAAAHLPALQAELATVRDALRALDATDTEAPG